MTFEDQLASFNFCTGSDAFTFGSSDVPDNQEGIHEAARSVIGELDLYIASVLRISIFRPPGVDAFGADFGREGVIRS